MSTVADLQHNPAAALDFLRRFHPGRSWNLVAIRAERKGIEALNLRDGPEAEAILAGWMHAHPADNLYYGVPELRSDFTGTKASKADVVAAPWIHVDLDPRKGADLDAERIRIQERLAAYSPPPTAVVFSGGGFQAFWRLKEPCGIGSEADAAEFERYNKQLCLDFETEDRCYSIDHVMRLPGSVNWPNEVKRRRGQKPIHAEVLEFHDDRSYSTKDFRKAAPEADATTTPEVEVARDEPSEPVELESMTLPEPLITIIREGRLKEPKKGDDSRSAWLFDAVCQLLRAGIDGPRVVAIIMDPRYRISESVLDKGRRALRYAQDQVRRGRAKSDKIEPDEKGRVADTLENISKAVAQMGVTLEYDEFAGKLNVAGLTGFGPVLQDAAVNRLRLQCESRFRLRVNKERFSDVVEDIARSYPRHPVREYLDAVEKQWDGRKRLDNLFAAYMPGPDPESDYSRAVGRLMLVAAVRRARRPGCKFDEMVVLESAQGGQKSTALSILAVKEDWFSDDLPLSATTKELMEATSGKWIVEAADLQGFTAADVEHLKAYLSRGTDRARMAYGRLSLEIPRHFIIIGTTNHDRYLRDSTGNRRFWPIRVGAVDIEELKRDRDQIWAEAAIVEATGAPIRLDRSLWGAAMEQQEQRRIEDPFLHRLQDMLGDKDGTISAEDCWTIVDVYPGQRTQSQNARLGAAMREMGWERVRQRIGGDGVPRWCYRKGRSTERLMVTATPQGTLKVYKDGEQPF